MENSKSKTRNRKLEIENSKSKTRNRKLEVVNSKWKTRNPKLEIQNSKSKTRNQKLEVENSKWKTQSRKLELQIANKLAKFWSKIQILFKKPNFGQKSKFGWTVQIMVKNIIFVYENIKTTPSDVLNGLNPFSN